MNFNTGKLRGISSYEPEADNNEIELEPMLFQADAAFADSKGGMLTTICLQTLAGVLSPGEFRALRIDTRSTLLGKGDCASRGGWHCDFMSERNYSVIEPGADEGVRHFMLVSGEPLTEFIRERNVHVDLPRAFEWADVNEDIRDRDVTAFAIEPMTLYEFDAYELHRAVPSANPGLVWRWFFRASYFPRGTEYANKIRKQVQVYR